VAAAEKRPEKIQSVKDDRLRNIARI